MVSHTTQQYLRPLLPVSLLPLDPINWGIMSDPRDAKTQILSVTTVPGEGGNLFTIIQTGLLHKECVCILFYYIRQYIGHISLICLLPCTTWGSDIGHVVHLGRHT